MTFRYTLFLLLCVALSVTATLVIDRYLIQQASEESNALSKQQGAQILKQLTEIRLSLQRVETNQAAKNHRPAVPKTASAPTRGRVALGSDDAVITVVEFTDYQCPFCNRFATNTFNKLKKAYIDTGKVRWVVLDMPLGFHKDAATASQAARCAEEQGRFWEYRKLLYSNQDKLSPEHLQGYAQQLGLDKETFNICFNSNKYDKQIKADMDTANQQQISGTPTFVIGRTTDDIISGTRVIGAQPYRVFSTAIDKQLAVK